MTENIFGKRIRIAMNLQDHAYSDAQYQQWRSELVDICREQVCALNPELVEVRLQRRFVEKFQKENALECIGEGDKGELLGKIASIVRSQDPDEYAKRFDNFMYGLILSHMEQMPSFRSAKKQVQNMAVLLEKKANVPKVKEKIPLIREIGSETFWEANDILLFEQVRRELRGIISILVEGENKKTITTSLNDPVTEQQEGVLLDQAYDFEDYRQKVNRYVEEHGNQLVIHKLKHNLPLTEVDYRELEHILTVELGSREEYRREFGDTSFGLLIRKIAKLDHDAAMQAFSQFINDESLTQSQIAFVHKVIHYVEQNGYMESVTALQKPPFDKPVSFLKLFNNTQREQLLQVIHSVKSNAENVTA